MSRSSAADMSVELATHMMVTPAIAPARPATQCSHHAAAHTQTTARSVGGPASARYTKRAMPTQ